jgi:hypothetical protein
MKSDTRQDSRPDPVLPSENDLQTVGKAKGNGTRCHSSFRTFPGSWGLGLALNIAGPWVFLEPDASVSRSSVLSAPGFLDRKTLVAQDVPPRGLRSRIHFGFGFPYSMTLRSKMVLGPKSSRVPDWLRLGLWGAVCSGASRDLCRTSGLEILSG